MFHMGVFLQFYDRLILEINILQPKISLSQKYI